MKIIRFVFWFMVLVFFAGLFLPQDYRVSRSVEIKSAAATIHHLTADLKQWPRWSPWLELEPSVKVTLGDKTSGVGANQSWTGNSGGGRLIFLASSPQSGIIYNLWFEEAKMPAISHINYITTGAGTTRVEWNIEGDIQVPVIGFYLALAMDSMIGPAFEQGLNNLKREAEQ